MDLSSTLINRKSQIKYLLNQLIDAHDYYITLMSIYKMCSSEKQLKLINKAYGFFHITIRALWSSLYMTLACVFDTHKDSMNFIKVLNGCQSDPAFPNEYYGPDFVDFNTGESIPSPAIPFDISLFVQNTLEDFSKLDYQKIIKKINILRDKRYAHNDEISTKYKVDYVSTKEALELIEFASSALINCLLLFVEKLLVLIQSAMTICSIYFLTNKIGIVRKKERSMITLAEIKQNENIRALIKAGNRYLEHLGYTDHGPRHLSYVSRTASHILIQLGYSEREIELAAIAGWVHDVGNSINRHDHGPNGAILLYPILQQAGMTIADALEIVTAVGNHEEESGTASSAVSAALIIADKSDAHKSRVRNGTPDLNDIHDRVNFAIQKNEVIVNRKTHVIRQSLIMDTSSSVLEYLHIYLPRILMCEKAARFLKQEFELVINGHPVNNQAPDSCDR